MTRVAVGSLVALVGLVAGVPASGVAQGTQPQKVGFVNSQLILAKTPGYAQAESTFAKEYDGYRSELARLQATLDSSAADFERSSVLLSPTAREAKRKDLEAQQGKLEQRTGELRDKAAARQRELLEPIQGRVTAVIEGIRAEGNFAMIFDINAPGNGIVTADKSLDLTDRVIARLQAGK